MQTRGILFIRSDIPAAVEPDYLAWLTREHTIERVGIDGFRSARMFRCCRGDVSRYVILYDLDHPAVVDSPAYLARLDHPTPWSARMMPHMGAFVRGGGAVFAFAGTGAGTALLPLMIDDAGFEIDWQALDVLARLPGIVAVRLVEADAGRTAAPTRERRLRGDDASFKRLLLIEALDLDSVRAAAASPSLVRIAGDGDPADAAYREIFHLARAELAG